MRTRILGGILPLLAIAMLMAAPAQAETVFVAELNGSQEVPPNSSEASGNGVFVLNDAQTELSFSIEYTGLEAPETGAHFHNAAPGQNGPAVFTLPPGSPKNGVWEIPSEMVEELLAGRIYVNIHTELYPGGEIRGDLHMEDPTPTRDSSWGQLRKMFGAE